jgi:ABC-type arginine transport system permease subunit
MSRSCRPAGESTAVSRVHMEVGRCFGADPLDLLLTVILPSLWQAVSPWKR